MTNTGNNFAHPSRRGFLGMTLMGAAGLGLSSLPGTARAQATGQVIVAGEITTRALVDIQSLVRETVRDIG